MYWRYLLVAALVLPSLLFSQISGKVEGYDGDTLIPLVGANVVWAGTTVGAVTDANGHFEIQRSEGANSLVASYIGYKEQTKIIISRTGTTNFILAESGSKLTEIEIIARLDATTVDLRAAELSYKVTGKELRKAACVAGGGQIPLCDLPAGQHVSIKWLHAGKIPWRSAKQHTTLEA